MTELVVHQAHALRGSVSVPGDKSISHRALLLGALAEGESHIEGFLPSGDCLATQSCLQSMGIGVIHHDATSLTVLGKGLHGLRKPAVPLNCVRSGTSMRLLAGILAGQPFDSVLTGESQLLRRPMRRVTDPLELMGASIAHTDGHAPLVINGHPLRGYEHHLKIASAQVKSALLLAGLFAEGQTVVHQPGPARDHTERMLAAQIGGNNDGARALNFDQHTVSIDPALIKHLSPLNLRVPGDISSASFVIVAALLVPNADLTITGVGINPTRTGLLDVLLQMGADITLLNVEEQEGEPVAAIRVRNAKLNASTVSGATVVRMIDEFPILAVAATQAHGITLVQDAAELRVKETDRIATIVEALQSLGAHIEARADGFAVEGPTPLKGCPVKSYHDHRLGMALAVAGLVADGQTTLHDADCIADSFPGFDQVLRQLGANIENSGG
jgi:3-phosphoshikimate 1-carboxyvinyltransferase